MVELALVMIPLMMVLYGLVYFGMAVATKQRVTNASAEGARAAVGQTAANAPTVAASRVQSLLGTPSGRYTIGPGPSPGPVVAACDPAVSGGPQCITVTVTWNWDTHPVVPAAPGLGVLPIPSLGSTAVVEYSG
jgi:Flp pilus assembly protein TadG